MARDEVQVRLKTWFLSNGGYLDDALDLTSDARSGQHFRAKSSLDATEENAKVLCQCPFSLSLSYLNILSSPPKGIRNCSSESICTHLLDKVPSAVQSYFFLCEQRLLGDKSFWAPYIEALPSEDDMTTPWWSDEKDLIWLLGTNIHLSSGTDKSGVEMRRAMWKAQWEEGVRVLQQAGADMSNFTWSLFLWAATIFSSRSFTSLIFASTTSGAQAKESFALLYPVLDSFNHKFGAKVLWNMDKGDFELRTTEPTQRGDEVFNNYAPKGNEELLNGYGFCIPDNPCDELALRIGKPPDPVVEALRQKYPTRFNPPEWTDESAVFFVRGSAHYSGGYEYSTGNELLRGIPHELLGTIKAILDYSYRQQGEEINPKHLEPAAVDAVLERLIAKYNGIKQWDESLPANPTNTRQRAAQIYRNGQLDILIEVIGELQEYVDSF